MMIEALNNPLYAVGSRTNPTSLHASIEKYLTEYTPNVYGALLCNFYAKCRETLGIHGAFDMSYKTLSKMLGDQALPISEARELTSALENESIALKRCPTCKLIHIDEVDTDAASAHCLAHR